jgi:hypothetical protein
MKAQRLWRMECLAALLPALLTVGWWQWAVWAFVHYGCIDTGKNLQPCFADGLNITGMIGLGLFWRQILSWVCVPLSLYLLFAVLTRHSGRDQRHLDHQAGKRQRH